MWDKLKDLVYSNSIDDTKRLFALLAPKLGYTRVEELAVLEPKRLAAQLEKVLGDIPQANWDDILRYAAAEKLILYAREQAERGQGERTVSVDNSGSGKSSAAAFKVNGRVIQPNGSALASLRVRAFDQGLRERRALLGESKTDAGGRYTIACAREKLIDPVKGGVSLVVEVVDRDGNQLALSKVKFNARGSEVVDFTIDSDNGKSEWENLTARLEPVLQGIGISELRDDELNFLAKRQRLKPQALKPVVNAARFAEESRLPRWFHYALIRQGLRADLKSLLETDVARISAAIETAQRAKVIPAADKRELAAIKQRFADLQVDHALNKTMSGRRLKTGTLFDLAGVPGAQQRALAGAMIGRHLRRPEDWARLAADAGLEKAASERLRLTLSLADFADDHEETVRALVQDNRIASLRDLARHYDPQDWLSLIDRTTIKDSLPGDLSGEKPQARRTDYARRLYFRAASAHPTVALAHGLGRRESLKTNRGAQLLPRIVEQDDRFDLASVRLDAYVNQKRKILGLESDLEIREATGELKRIQRLYRLKPEMTVVARLLEDEAITSAGAIVSRGRRRFVEKYGTGESLGPDTALSIYREAEKTAARAFAFYAHFSPIINTTHLPTAIHECPAELTGVPDYPTLFGTLDGCLCESCESVYSPAAYLTDLLAFLEQEVERNPEFEAQDLVPDNGLQALESRSTCDTDNRLISNWPRRPDIARTLLSCRNADTELPYVDLVLEILENAVEPRSGDDSPQTTLSTDQLAAQPEHFNAQAYRKLAEAIFPFSLPFDLWHEEETLYLEKLGTSRAELLEALYPFWVVKGSVFPAGEPHDLTEIRRWQDREVARARLGLNTGQWAVISNPDSTDAVVSKAWGYATDSNGWKALQKVDTLLRHSGLDYRDLLHLLQMKSFNPSRAIAIDPDDAAACDPQTTHLEGLNGEALGFLHRFLRLQGAMGWRLGQMDLALMSLSAPSTNGTRPLIDTDFLVRLSHLVGLQTRFKLPLDELLSWWAPLDTRDYRVPQLPNEDPAPSLYARLFLAGRPGEPEFKVFQLNAARRELVDPTRPLNKHLSAVAGALRLTQPDLDMLIDNLEEMVEGGRLPGLSLANLSLLFRHASLARALAMTIEDYLTLKRLIGFDPFSDAQLAPNEPLTHTLQTLRFVQRAEMVKSSGFSIAELDYLLHQTKPYTGHTVAPTQAWVGESLGSLKDQVASLTQDEAMRDQSVRETLQAALAEILEVPPGVCKVLLEQVPLPEDPTKKAVDALLAAFLPRPVQPPGNGVPTAGDLVDDSGSSPDAGDGDTDADTAAEAAEPSMNPALMQLLYRLHKAALVVNRLAITHQELMDDGNDKPRYITMSQPIGWLDLTRLPVRDGDPPAPFDTWMRTVELFGMRDRLPADQQAHLFDLFDIAAQYQPGLAPFAGNERQAYIGTLTALSGWPEADIGALVGKFDIGQISHGGGGMLKAAFPRHFADERLIKRIFACVRLFRRLGVTAFEVDGWMGDSPNQAPRMRVERIRNALKARYGDGWSDILRPLRDPLREQQRQALVAYLMHVLKVERADDLFDHFLIDVEMTPCMMTSRLIQATAAVQLFVQRVTMNLEPGLVLTEEGAEMWAWMKNYRIWEANRKIFLYPENWIEPDLRDDKTPFFKELENELMQADITNETAETALLHYLEKLHDVARLQICGQYLDMNADPLTLHVFGRTRDVPHHYYYRRGILDGFEGAMQALLDREGAEAALGELHAYWTPWEKVDLDIEGDHLIPMVYNRRVYLFWPTFTEKDEMPFENIGREINTFLRIGMMVLQTLFKATLGAGEMLADGLNTLIGGVQASANSILNALPAFLGNDPNDDDPNAPPAGDGGPPSVALNPIENLLSSFSQMAGQLADVDLTDTDTNELFNDFSSILSDVAGSLVSLLPAKRVELQLCWSEYKNDIWSDKKTSSGRVSYRDVITPLIDAMPTIPGAGKPTAKRLFSFRGDVDEHNSLRVRCRIALPSEEACTALPETTLASAVEVGYFRMNGCNGRLDAVDLPEHPDLPEMIGTLVSDVTTSIQEQIEEMSDELHGVPQFQTGEPVTPDDDPRRPSPLRCGLESVPLPRHFHVMTSLLTNEAIEVEDTYRILSRHQGTYLMGKDISDKLKFFGFFYQDADRVFFSFPWRLPKNNPGSSKEPLGFVFFPFYHPYTCALLENIQRFGIPGLYDVRYNSGVNGVTPNTAGKPLQIVLKDETYFKPVEYDPIGQVYNPPDGLCELRPIEEFNFSTIGAYAQYNWEIFFHIPLLIATRLSTNQKFREAQQWFHYIFNPTDASRGAVPQKYWRTRPLVESSQADYHSQDIDQLLTILNSDPPSSELKEIERAVRRWQADAFNPHLVARSRTVAFQKTVVMKYIDNLIAWGDSLFRRETREAVNEAMQLYVLAAKLLGPRPRRIPRSVRRADRHFDQLKDTLDAFSNALTDFENVLPVADTAVWIGSDASRLHRINDHARLDRATLAPVGSAFLDLIKSPTLRHVARVPGTLQDLYFCVPPNDRLIDKWDLVADRLFKIRHCRNIHGQKLELPLLAPPVDPEILVRAKAAGVEIGDAVGALAMPLPHYRFQVVAQKAAELCGEVKSLGAAMLAAMEKRDGEAMALLRSTHERRLLEAVQDIKKQQITEARTSLEALKQSRIATRFRRDHYQGLLTQFMNPEELAHNSLMTLSLLLQAFQTGIKWGAVPASLIPNIKGGFVTTLGVTYGGGNTGDAVSRASDAIGSLASTLGSAGGLISTMGSYRRRAEDWLLQIFLAQKEFDGLEKQIAAAEIRVAIAEADLENQVLQIQNSLETQEFMQQKFTNRELYDWMVAQTSTLYFKSYQMAVDMARKAERAYAHELGTDSPEIIQTGYWDNLKKGLLAGDYLYHDLKRLEVAYLDHNRREYELTKHVSLSALDPTALVRLREIGEAVFGLPEALFDMDFPGHYMRRIKSVSLSIPCVAGPYSGVSATLRLMESRIRCKPEIPNGSYGPTGDTDLRFIKGVSAKRSVATSTGQNDSGLFEMNFRDERYLPFEGEGVESLWSLSIDKQFAPFDLDTISDVVLHVRYTARDGGETLKNAASEALATSLQTALTALDGSPQPLTQLFSVRHDFPDDWSRFQGQAPAADSRFALSLNLRTEHYPFWCQGRLNAVTAVQLFARSAADSPLASLTIFQHADPGNLDTKGILNKDTSGNPLFGHLLVGGLAAERLPAKPTGELTFYFKDNALSDLWIAVTWHE